MKRLPSFWLVLIYMVQKGWVKRRRECLIFLKKLAGKVNASREFDWKGKRASKFMLVIYVLTGVLEISIPGVILLGDEVLRMPSLLEIILILFMAVFLYFIMLLMVLIVASLLLLLLIGLTELFCKLTNLVVRIFKSYQLEGVFLFIGTLLFLLSKYVQLYA